jgi:hypothetical protein
LIKFIRHIILLILVSSSLIFSQQPVLRVSPAEMNINAFSIGEIVIKIDSVNAFRAYSIHLSYDPQRLRCLSITQATFFSNWQTFYYEVIDSNAGLLKIDEAILGVGYENGSGDLIKVQFQALIEGDVNLNFVVADLRDTSNSQIEIQTENGIIHILDPTSVDDVTKKSINNNLLSYPNPFNSSTRIEYTPAYNLETKFDIYSITGEKVFSFTAEPQNGQNISFVWNGNNNNGELLPSGMYLLTAKNNNEFKKTILELVFFDSLFVRFTIRYGFPINAIWNDICNTKKFRPDSS